MGGARPRSVDLHARPSSLKSAPNRERMFGHFLSADQLRLSNIRPRITVTICACGGFYGEMQSPNAHVGASGERVVLAQNHRQCQPLDIDVPGSSPDKRTGACIAEARWFHKHKYLQAGFLDVHLEIQFRSSHERCSYQNQNATQVTSGRLTIRINCRRARARPELRLTKTSSS